ncbi:hypothetical protein C8J56DRAFT_1168365 [Mycena floridula]|nr:hypothetical protein C8J56DRAFT_1168365 [Mycena floridula]
MSRSESNPSFPQETFEEIIGFLFLEIAALAACSLVCRSWTIPSRRHMFNKVVLKNKKRTEEFLDLAKNPNATFLGAISSFSLHESAQPTVTLTFLQSRLVNGPRQILSLSLSGDSVLEDIASWKDIANITEGISCLTLAGFTTGSFEDFLQLISSFPSLQALDIRPGINFSFVPQRDSSQTYRCHISASLCRLSIRLGEEENRIFTDWIMASPKPLSLSHLDTEWGLISSLSALIHKYSPVLHLSNTQFWKSLLPSSVETLVNLDVKAVVFRIEQYNGSGDPGFIETVISRMPTLQSVSIHIWLHMHSPSEWATRSSGKNHQAMVYYKLSVVLVVW